MLCCEFPQSSSPVIHTMYKKKNRNVTNAMLKDKARELNAQFRTNHSLKGSLRWVTRFKERSNFRKEDISKDLGNQYEADIFKAEIRKLLQDGEYTLDNVYNADCAALMWKAVPEKTLLFEKSQSRRRMGEGQVTTFLCANATGCHKLPVLIIATIEHFPSFNSFHTSDPSIMNKTNTKPFMDSNILNEWFNKCFLKLVTERQQKNGHREKTLLLLNNGGSDRENRIISTKDEFVKIMYYSYEAAPFIQPIDRRIIACFKRMYRNELLESLMPTSNSVSEEELIHIYSQLNIDDCCRMVHNAWSKIKSPILKNAWDKLLKDESERSSEDPEIIKKDIDEALTKLNKIPGCGGCDSIAVMNWFETDKEHNTDTQDDIQETLLDFINAATNTEANEL
ncbi:jerky protein homolog-like [Bombus huntii]|uniref:jerky protein homolog-like n=1 Tax=Bombus huntii TaxID=85661 RepID=UPI0021AA6713|nr:jerky protein homolog-like [Bombus huntii]